MTEKNIKIPEFKFNASELFELNFNIDNLTLSEAVKSIAISSKTNKIYIKMTDIKYDNIFISDYIRKNKKCINKLTLNIYDKEGNITESQDFNGKIIDIASFDYNYARIISDILIVFKYE